MRRTLLALALSLAASAPAYALPGDETLLLDLCINDRCIGVAPVIARGDDVLVDREALQIGGIETAGVATEHLGERDFVSLHALNHGSTFAIDRTLLRLDLKLRADQLPAQRASFSSRPEMDAIMQPWTAFLNYAGTMGEREERSLYFDAAVGRGNGAFRSTLEWSGLHGWRRDLTRFELDQPSALRRWTVGDQYATPHDPLGGGRLIGGIGVERAFDDDPYLVTFPRPYFSGVLEAPGTVEIYSNGVLIGRKEVGAGPFTLEQLGIQPGRNDVRVIVRDPFGNRSELATRSYYGGSPRLLARGLSEYAFRVGVPRDNGGRTGGYGSATTYQGWYRRGLSDAFTVGGRIEGDDAVRNAGLDAAMSTPLGEFALAWATSQADVLGRGNAYGANYSFSSRVWTVGLGTRRAEATYRNLDDPLSGLLGTIRVTDYASLAFAPAGPFSLQFNAGRERREGMPVERTYGATGTLQLWDGAQLFLSAQRTESAAFHDTGAQLSLNIGLGRDNLTFSGTHDRGDSGTHNGFGFDARRSRPTDTGWGYTASVQHDDLYDRAFGQVEYQNRFARLALEGEHIGSDSHVRARASGALVAIGGRVFATPPVDNGFALVRAPGLPGMPILRENVPVGTTDARGDLLVRGMLPYYANGIAIDETALPASFELASPKRNVQVARNTGAVLQFDARSVRAVTGHFRYAGAAAGDLARVGADTEGTPIGTDGRFYFEGLAPGPAQVRVEGNDGMAQCSIAIPTAGTAVVVDLGEIKCVEVR